MNVQDEVMAELARATAKFPTWPTDPLHALAVLGEEFGELTKAMLQHTYEPHKGVTQQDIRDEAIQTAAMALRLAMSLPVYDYRKATQHSQSGPDLPMNIGANDRVQLSLPTHAPVDMLIGWVNPAPNASPVLTPNGMTERLAGAKVYCCYGAYADVGHDAGCPNRKG